MGADEAGREWTRMTVDAKRASRYSFSGPAATVTAMRALLDGDGATTGEQPVRGVIYSDDDGAPDRPLARTYETTIVAGQSAKIITLYFPSPIHVPDGAYWLGLHSGGTTAVARYAATISTSALRYNPDDYSDGPSSLFDTASADDKAMSLVVIGTAG